MLLFILIDRAPFSSPLLELPLLSDFFLCPLMLFHISGLRLLLIFQREQEIFTWYLCLMGNRRLDFVLMTKAYIHWLFYYIRFAFSLLQHILNQRVLAVPMCCALGKTDPARRYLGKATSLDRLFGPAWLAYGHSFAVENEHDQAMAAYFKASQLMKGYVVYLKY